jgi:hypothetical protein
VSLANIDLRDLPAPEQLYQLEIDGLPAAFPPLRNVERAPIALPAQIAKAASDATAVWTLIRTLIGPVSCVSCVSSWYWANAAETHETIHRESGMRCQLPATDLAVVHGPGR